MDAQQQACPLQSLPLGAAAADIIGRTVGWPAPPLGRIKRGLGLPIYDSEREALILDRIERASPGPLDPTAVRRVFERIIDESRRLERLAANELDEED